MRITPRAWADRYDLWRRVLAQSPAEARSLMRVGRRARREARRTPKRLRRLAWQRAMQAGRRGGR